ncbi:MAG TPA: LysR substrate-binding domain-containing protein [Burkholderiaceae bacterium]|nr:LysR substrate-binding domain-containing protein [Burkholderiaceae bacterium]
MPAPKPRRRRPIGLAGLRGFDAAARHLSFTLAAAELNLTQSSISRQIAALERQIGRPLFERRTRALELTAAGERLFAAVRQAVLAVDRTVDEIRGDGGTPRVTITTYASFASLWLVPRLPDFQQQHPGVDIRIDASDRMIELESDDVDIAIRWLRPGAPVPTDALLLQAEEATPALSPRLLAERPAPLRNPSDLATLPMLAMDESVPSAPYSNWTRWCEFAGVPNFDGAARLYFTYVDQSVQAAVRGQGVALVRTPFVDDLVASGDLVTPFPSLRMPTGYRYFLIVNRKRANVPHVAAFRAWVISEFQRGPHRLT